MTVNHFTNKKVSGTYFYRIVPALKMSFMEEYEVMDFMDEKKLEDFE